MSDIQGIGPKQPIRPAAPLNRAPRTAPEADTAGPSSFGADAVSVTGTPAKAASPAAAPAARVDAEPLRAPAPTPAPVEVGGFLLAGSGRVGAGMPSGGYYGEVTTSPTGALAVIEDAVMTGGEFPMLDLNGPSSVAQGIIGLSGSRVA